jgi:hypothetical protein
MQLPKPNSYKKWRLSMESTFPNWKEGSEFKLKRDTDCRIADFLVVFTRILKISENN